MRDGRFKVASHLAEWFDEFRGYHRKEGLIVKMNDDLMSATRIAVMAHREARPDPLAADNQWWKHPRQQVMTAPPFDLFTGKPV